MISSVFHKLFLREEKVMEKSWKSKKSYTLYTESEEVNDARHITDSTGLAAAADQRDPG